MWHGMTLRRGWTTITLAAVIAGGLLSRGTRASEMPVSPALLEAAVSPDSAVAEKAIAALRGEGPSALAALLAAHADEIRRHYASRAASAADQGGSWERLAHAADTVAAQRDACTSGLYWYTDLAAAQAAARGTGKPILSLRLLGKLDEDLSCANSRFFRTVLYANAQVSRALRDGYILHWKSERPVPVVTIDFGDGRKIRRTITGNSIHYVLDGDARVIDAIPGLYGPDAFLRQIADAAAVEKVASTAGNAAERQLTLFRWHMDQKAAEELAYRMDLGKLGIVTMSAKTPVFLKQVGRDNGAPPAAVAGRVARGKNAIESPVVAAVAPEGMIAAATDDARWVRIAALHATDARLDPASVALIAAKNPGAAGGVAVSKTLVESPLVRLVRNFQNSVAIDTVRNEYLLHPSIHEWLATEAGCSDMETLNTRVYAELFLTPRSDPWLGLVAPETYTGLDADPGPSAKAE